MSFFTKAEFKGIFVLFQSLLFLFPYGRKEKRIAAAFPQPHKRGMKKAERKKCSCVEGEDEWRVAGLEILSFPVHKRLVSMTGQLQICFILSWLCVCGNGRLPVSWSL